jgi:hypothetical protein
VHTFGRAFGARGAVDDENLVGRTTAPAIDERHHEEEGHYGQHDYIVEFHSFLLFRVVEFTKLFVTSAVANVLPPSGDNNSDGKDGEDEHSDDS